MVAAEEEAGVEPKATSLPLRNVFGLTEKFDAVPAARPRPIEGGHELALAGRCQPVCLGTTRHPAQGAAAEAPLVSTLPPDSDFQRPRSR